MDPGFITLSLGQSPDSSSTNSSEELQTSSSSPGESSSSSSSPASSPGPESCTHDTRRSKYHVKDIGEFAQVLETAANRALPNRDRARYKNVESLLFRWEEDELEVEWELNHLEKVLQAYGFHTQTWLIPSQSPLRKVMGKALEFIDKYENEDTLFIVYYGGHAKINQARQSTWSCTRNWSYSSFEWNGCQSLFEQSKSDTLLLFDCCSAAAAAAAIPCRTDAITETIAACGWETWTPIPGRHSFTNALIEVLEEWIDRKCFSAAMLHSEILSILKSPRPKKHQEISKTPVYIVTTSNPRNCSIEIRRVQSIKEVPFEPSSAPPGGESAEQTSTTTTSKDQFDLASLLATLPAQEKTFALPHVIISVGLEGDQTLDRRGFENWMKQFPALATYVKIQGVYGSHSTLILLSIPVVIWNLLPRNPAYNFVGFVTSDNLLDIRRSENASENLQEPAQIQKEYSSSRQQNNALGSKVYPVGPDQNHDEEMSQQAFINPSERKAPSETQVEIEGATICRDQKLGEKSTPLHQKRLRYSSPTPSNEVRGRGYNSMDYGHPIADVQKHQAIDMQKRPATKVAMHRAGMPVSPPLGIRRSDPRTATLTADGPGIGDLVVIVDRGENFQNRETVGNQNLYCVVTLDKQAKETEPYRHGGQTPIWDQGFTFIVRDSPNYYQLKVAVFNRDKTTSLTGAALIDLRGVVVPGGGQNELWCNLNCKGKYAGEIRLEITYYDHRPKKAKLGPAGNNRMEEGRALRKPAIIRRSRPSGSVLKAPAAAPVRIDKAVANHDQIPPPGYQPPPSPISMSPISRSYQASPPRNGISTAEHSQQNYSAPPPPDMGTSNPSGGDPWALLEDLVNTDLGSARRRRGEYSDLATTSPTAQNARSNGSLSRTISQPRGLNVLSSKDSSRDETYRSSTQTQSSKSMRYAPQRIPATLTLGTGSVVGQDIWKRIYKQNPENPPWGGGGNQSPSQ